MNASVTPVDVHVRCLTPEFAAGLYHRLRAHQFRPTALVGTLVVVSTDGSEAAAQEVRAFVGRAGVAPAAGVCTVPRVSPAPDPTRRP